MDTLLNRRRTKTVTKIITGNSPEEHKNEEPSTIIDNFTLVPGFNAIKHWSPKPIAHSNSSLIDSRDHNDSQVELNALHPNNVKHLSIFQPPGAHLNYTHNRETAHPSLSKFVQQPSSESKLQEVSDTRPKAKTTTKPTTEPKRWQIRHGTAFAKRDSEFSAEKTLFSYVNSKMHHDVSFEASMDEHGNIISQPRLQKSFSGFPFINNKSRRESSASKRSICNKFKQQDITGYYFLPSSKCAIVCNLFLGICLLIAGGIVFAANNRVIEQDIPYNSNCTLNSVCSYPFTINQDTPAPVYVYLKVFNLFQNHQIYIKSLDTAQLDGNEIPPNALSDCSPIQTVGDLSSNQQYSINGDLLNTSAAANPCGLFASNFFTDTFIILDENNNSIAVNTSDIAWSVDKDDRFKRNPNYLTTQWIDVEDERFMNWMNFATLPDWKKLWGRIDMTLTAGNYTLIVYDTYDVNSFSGDKMLTLSTITLFGGTSLMLVLIFFSLGGIYFILAIIVFVYAKVKRLDDSKVQQAENLEWTH